MGLRLAKAAIDMILAVEVVVASCSRTYTWSLVDPPFAYSLWRFLTSYSDEDISISKRPRVNYPRGGLIGMPCGLLESLPRSTASPVASYSSAA